MVAIFINSVQGLHNPHAKQWNMEPDIDRFPAYVFDWTLPQFLAREQALHERTFRHHMELAPRSELDLDVAAMPTPVASTVCFIDEVVVVRETGSERLAGQPVTLPKSGAAIVVRGWAVEKEDAAGGVVVEIDGRRYAASYGLSRTDVANNLGSRRYRHVGFEASIPLSRIAVGAHTVSLKVRGADSETYYNCESSVPLDVRAAPRRP